MPPANKITLTGVMAEHAKNKAHPGIIVPKIKDHMLKEFGPDLDRDPTVIHPSEMAKADWCLRATYLRIVSGKWPEDAERFDFIRENIFETGNDIHAKWQSRMIDAGLPIWGDWSCRICRSRHTGLAPDTQYGGCHRTTIPHDWRYDEVTLNTRDQLLIAGHSDGGFDNSLVEIKSIGLGTIRMDAPDLLRKHQDGRMTDLTGLWRDITRPLRSHLAQGDVYLHLAHVLGLPFDQIVYLYEFKPNQMVKEFTVKYDARRSMRLVAKAEEIKYAVEHGIPPKCTKPSGCKQCKVFPQPRRRTVAGTRDAVTAG